MAPLGTYMQHRPFQTHASEDGLFSSPVLRFTDSVHNKLHDGFRLRNTGTGINSCEEAEKFYTSMRIQTIKLEFMIAMILSL
ncbi:hypothetical protein KL942_002863 [Ogataea angusta]|uniref:Uncharacterized protein n=1 Tax=Pichia angusta TaxID=870730 RepID=A0ABQ7RTN7_PICAN|nr:hypothetical protein KL942_002863 [Ogataea angusta]KAG7847393.1 hypothetical protein KL940_003729 [Ogataea angusta]